MPQLVDIRKLSLNSKVKKLTDEVLIDVAGGLENTKPLSTAVLTDEAMEESKSQKKENHEIEA